MNKPQRKPNSWLQALKIFNENRSEYLVPKKGTPEYDIVKQTQINIKNAKNKTIKKMNDIKQPEQKEEKKEEEVKKPKQKRKQRKRKN